MPSSTARGLGAEHRRARAALLPYAYGKPCPLCGEVMAKGQALDLDHVVPRAHGGHVRDGVRITHASCNRSRGAGNAPRQRIAPPVTSQPW